MPRRVYSSPFSSTSWKSYLPKTSLAREDIPIRFWSEELEEESEELKKKKVAGENLALKTLDWRQEPEISLWRVL